MSYLLLCTISDPTEKSSEEEVELFDILTLAK